MRLLPPHTHAPHLLLPRRTASFQQFLTDKIKVDGRPGMLGESIKVSVDKSKLTITSDIHLSKR